MLLDIILSGGSDFNAKCQIRCRWLGGFSMLIGPLICWWYGCVLISLKKCVYLSVCVFLLVDTGMVNPGAGRPVSARLERLAVLPQEVTQKSSRDVYERLRSLKTCRLTWLSPACNSTVGKVLLLLEGFGRCVCDCVCVCVLHQW